MQITDWVYGRKVGGNRDVKALSHQRHARRGASLRKLARRFHVSLLTVQRWVERSNGQRLDRVIPLQITDWVYGRKVGDNRDVKALSHQRHARQSAISNQ